MWDKLMLSINCIIFLIYNLIIDIKIIKFIFDSNNCIFQISIICENILLNYT